MRCIIIDDEKHCISVLKQHIKRLPKVKLVGTADNPLLGIKMIEKEKPDVVFLDVHMNEMSGYEVMKVIGGYTKVVFCSAEPEWEVRSKGPGAVEYLVKPVGFQRFVAALEKVKADH